MRKFIVRSAVVLAALVVGLSGLAGVAGASVESGGALAYGTDELHIDEMPEEKTTASTCSILERQGSSGYGALNRNGVKRVYEFAGWSSDPQGYIDMRVNVYEDTGRNWIMPGGWSKGDLLGFTFIGCS